MRSLLLTLVLSAFTVSTALGAPIDDAKKLYRNGSYSEAVARLKPLYKASPRDGTVGYYLGASLYALGRNYEAIAPLKVAVDKNVADASRILMEIALADYDVDLADKHLDAWETALSKAKKSEPAEMDDLRAQLVLLRNMLQRVEKIEIIDSINVDAADFFTHYRLSNESGRLLLPEETDVRAKTLVYLPQNHSEMIWAESDSTGRSVLMSASILDDGTLDRPSPLKGNFSESGDADYPFLMPDGTTLYFAATGEGSIGGYDIFMTRRTEDGFLQPQNVGMPYNSTANDYMLAIDETTGAGWFASDRAGIEGKVTIYVFVPSQSRVNYSPDDPHLADKARITSIAATQTSDPRPLLDKIASISEVGEKRSRAFSSFIISMGNGKIYTSLDDFSNRQARLEMAKLLNEESELTAQINRLDQLRARYRAGDRTVADQILDAEAAIEFSRQTIDEHRNKVIRLETK